MPGMSQGSPDARPKPEPLLSVAPAAALAALTLVLGLYLPPGVRAAIADAARLLG